MMDDRQVLFPDQVMRQPEQRDDLIQWERG